MNKIWITRDCDLIFQMLKKAFIEAGIKHSPLRECYEPAPGVYGESGYFTLKDLSYDRLVKISYDYACLCYYIQHPNEIKEISY